MGKWIIRILGVIAVLVVAAYIFRANIFEFMMSAGLKPSDSFENTISPEAPDYTSAAAWAALPETEDPADFSPVETGNNQAIASADVFFVHPTTYLSKDGWNAPFNDEGAQEYIDGFVLQGQASSFNGCCAIYAPQYRQATLWSYFDETGDGKRARALAYTDVARAFDNFLTRIGPDRPFILAGHSQGGDHLFKLMEEKISGSPLRERLIAAYPIGFADDESQFGEKVTDIPVCQSAGQTGCYVTWNALGEKAEIWWEGAGPVCVNPLTWNEDEQSAPAEKNPGSLSTIANNRYEAGVTGAKCDGGRLLVGPFNSDLYDDVPMMLGKDNYHVLDYALFYGAVRENAILRTQTYLEERAESINSGEDLPAGSTTE